MRVLVTGGTGFVGSHAVRLLQRDGHQLRLLVRNREKATRIFGADMPFELVDGDITDPDSVERAMEGAEAVVHAAAVVAIETRRADEVLNTNLRGVELVVGGAHQRGVASIVYVSSLGALFQPGSGPITADSPVAEAETAYGRSKAEGERFVRDLQAEGAPIRTVYPQGIIGPDDPGLSEGNHTVMIFLRDLMVDTSTGFEVIDVRDLAEVIASLVSTNHPDGRYVLPGYYLPWPKAIALMDELTGRRVRRVKVPGSVLRALGVLGDWVKHVYPFDFPLSAEAMHFATQWPGTVPSRTFETLGLKFRDGPESYRDTIRWLHRAGHLTSDQAGKLARD